MAELDRLEMKRSNTRSEILSPEQRKKIKGLWNIMGLTEIAREIGVSKEAVNSFAKSHYLYLNYLR